MTNTTHLGITLVEQSQAQKEVTVNQAITRIDAILNTGAKSRGSNTPPGSPANGDVHIVGSSPTSDWTGWANFIAYFDQTWKFIIPKEGVTLWVNDEDTIYVYTGSFWMPQNTGNVSSFLNKFRNAPMDVWQRGTSGTITAGAPGYTADGWVVSATGANVTWAQAAGRVFSAYSLKVTGNTSVTNTFIRQRIESFLCYPIAGQTVSFQAYIFNNTGASITPTITVKHAGAVDNWSSPVTDVNAQNLPACANGAWTQVYYTFSAHNSSGNGLEFTIDFGSTLDSNAKFVQLCEIDIRLSQVIFSPELRPVHTELAFCQRYLPAYNPGATPIAVGATGQCTSTTAGGMVFDFPVPTRIAPTGVTVSSAAHFGVTNASGTVVALSTLTFANACPTGGQAAFSVASGLVAGNAAILYTQNAAAQVLFTGAEL